MMKRNAILKCADCGFAAEVVAECGCTDCAVSCCGKPMTVLQEKTADAKGEKHVPYPMDNGKGGTKVLVGQAMAHPMIKGFDSTSSLLNLYILSGSFRWGSIMK